MTEKRCGIDITVGVLAQLVSYLGHARADIGTVFHSAGSDPAILDDPDARIPFETYIAIEEAAANLTGDPCMGLHMGEFFEPGNWSIAGHYMSRCATLGETFAKGGRYARIIGNLIRSKAWPIVGGIRVQMGVPRLAPPMSRHCYEAVLASSITLARRLTGLPVNALAVRLTGPRPADDSEYRRVFRCPVQFGAKHPGMDIPFSMVNLPLLAPDPLMAAYFEAWADDMMARLPPLRMVSAQVTRLILEYLDEESLSAKAVARELGMSLRLLQSRLAEEGTEFSSLLRQARETLARRYLRENKTVEDITCWLGFAEPSVFRKAFKKWTGLTPVEYRLSADTEQADLADLGRQLGQPGFGLLEQRGGIFPVFPETVLGKMQPIK